MTKPTMRMTNLGPYSNEAEQKLPFTKSEKDALVVQSALGTEATSSEHVVWLCGVLDSHRPYIKRLLGMGAKLTFTCTMGATDITLAPNALTGLHLLGAELVITQK